jgi:DNA polymerase-3 subunit gamma/tau
MLLKGHEEVKSSPRPHAAADMVLVRLAYAADLPTPGDLMRRLGDSGNEGESKPRAIPDKQAPREPAPAMRREAPPAPKPAPSPTPTPVAETEDPAPPPSLAEPKSFEEVVALADEKRDLKLKHALSEQVRLVRFRPGHLELNPLPTAPKELGQDLMRKLKAWTGRVWIVALSGEEGAAPLGVQRREREAREIERIRNHPEVKQVLEHFPDARIAAVRAVKNEEPPAEIDEGTETEFKEDGTDP